jgi:hypothetical protein
MAAFFSILDNITLAEIISNKSMLSNALGIDSNQLQKL